ncbi:MAG: sulfite exporter TauE/SafE family protein [Bacteroidetes bacterium]|nr:sulfite exporter TauE/SafE family protein [Bacteroidota bacterium]
MPDIWTIDLSVAEWVLFLVAGVATGVINTLSGSGSLITLPIFVFVCGLPAPVANGTNRVGVVLQSAVGLGTYVKSGKSNFEGATWLVIPSVVGAIFGAAIAAKLDDETMNLVLGGLLIFMLIVLVAKPSRWIHEMPVEIQRNKHPLTVLAFFAIGVYGGFIQAGVGIFLLAGLVLISRYSLSSANGVKLLVVLMFGIPALGVFIWHGQVHMGYGLAMAIFQAFGAWIAVKWVVNFKNADVWIHRLLILMVAGAAVKFLW